ncbi:hypothetical protein PCANC_28809 [Puccinia coronata f. sp. avenae]|uniref:Uncharacterized protein n=1 Tax=Puccinia coronata f. sp. avenae TaxID=200324 RepID=A0A2N5TIP7_9BASI|nr:hypothetical protein PCANC_28809 [Puccinia coronata f. sp. avenae]
MADIGHWESTPSLNGRYQPLREYTLSQWLISSTKRAIKSVDTLLMTVIGHRESLHSLMAVTGHQETPPVLLQQPQLRQAQIQSNYAEATSDHPSVPIYQRQLPQVKG